MSNNDLQLTEDLKTLLKLEYEQASEDWRNRDSMLWQTLAILIAITGIASTVAFNTQLPKSARTIALLFTLALNLISLIKITKDHYYQIGSKTYMSMITKTLCQMSSKEFLTFIYNNDCTSCADNTNSCNENPRHHYCKKHSTNKKPFFYCPITKLPAFKTFFYMNISLIIVISIFITLLLINS